MSKPDKIEGTSDAWEKGILGLDEKHAKLSSSVDENKLDDSLGLQSISIRMQKSLLEDLKFIAKHNGIGYQPLMKQILRRFASAEIGRIARELSASQTGTGQPSKDTTETEDNSRAYG